MDTLNQLWSEINGFDGWNDFEEFVSKTNLAVENGIALEMEVKEKYNVMDLKERWYMNRQDGVVWRLVWPDPPFGGVFEPISKKAQWITE